MTSNAESIRAAASSPTGSDDLHPVEVEGRERVVVSASRSDDFPRATRTCTVECASGERTTDEWTGVPLRALVEAADFPGETTHLHVEADDFAAQVPVRAALDGVLAFDRGKSCDDKEGRDDKLGLPRFIASGVDGERLVKRVRRVRAVELDPEDDPLVG